MSKLLRNLMIGAGVAAVGGIGTKLAVDYFKNRGEEEAPPEPEDEEAEEVKPSGAAEVAYAVVEQSSVQDFLDRSFGNPGRYVPNRPPKVFEYQEQQYMVIWADDNDQGKKQMMAFHYGEDGQRHMVASVGYTADKTDYNINLDGMPLAVEIESNGEQISSGQGETEGTEEVDLIPVA